MPADPIEIRPAPDAARIAKLVVDEHHAHLRDGFENGALHVFYAFTNQRRTNRGRITLATTAKLSPVQRYLAAGEEQVRDGDRDEFLVLISLMPWSVMSDAQKEALIDHELQHIAFNDETERFVLRGHDLEDFVEIVQRRGLWTPTHELFGKAAAEQLKLLDPDAIRPGVNGAA